MYRVSTFSFTDLLTRNFLYIQCYGTDIRRLLPPSQGSLSWPIFAITFPGKAIRDDVYQLSAVHSRSFRTRLRERPGGDNFPTDLRFEKSISRARRRARALTSPGQSDAVPPDSTNYKLGSGPNFYSILEDDSSTDMDDKKEFTPPDSAVVNADLKIW